MDNKQSQLGSHLISENSTARNTHTSLEEAQAAAVRDGNPHTVEAGKSMVKICVTVVLYYRTVGIPVLL